MEKTVKEARIFCDICTEDELARYKCRVCKKDLCPSHSLTMTIHLERSDRCFRIELCPGHALPMLPILQAYAQFPDVFESAGHNIDFNDARLNEILIFLAEERDRER